MNDSPKIAPAVLSAAGLDREERRTKWKQRVSQKDFPQGEEVASCGHLEPGGPGYLFDGCFEHEGSKIFWLACCQACAEASNYDLGRVCIVDVVVSGEPS